jgi:peptide-methionine (R)-S-oxide reductase
MAEKIKKTDAEWKKELTPEQYYVMRKKGTEPPFTGKYCDAKEQGTYVCAACGQPLFESKTKFESGTGWPSFTAPLAPGNVEEESDSSHGMIRTEAKCGRCEAHLGHVFDDGPSAAGGMRYCINSASLKLESAKLAKK